MPFVQDHLGESLKRQAPHRSSPSPLVHPHTTALLTMPRLVCGHTPPGTVFVCQLQPRTYPVCLCYSAVLCFLFFTTQVDDQHLPDTATDATKVIQAWLLTLLRRHPQLDAAAAGSDGGLFGGAGSSSSMSYLQQLGDGAAAGQLHLDVHITGHSLGGLLSEVATVESTGFAARHGAEWYCTSFESPGLPDL